MDLQRNIKELVWIQPNKLVMTWESSPHPSRLTVWIQVKLVAQNHFSFSTRYLWKIKDVIDTKGQRTSVKNFRDKNSFLEMVLLLFFLLMRLFADVGANQDEYKESNRSHQVPSHELETEYLIEKLESHLM